VTKRVLDVGNCGPDFVSIKRFLTHHFNCEVVPVDGPEDALAELRRGDYALVLVNRKLDRDYSDGIEVIKLIKADTELRGVSVMLVTNYPEHQDAAVAIGAERGFGKLALGDVETLERLKAFLTEAPQ
jgi:two-component system, chemotaxis family, chemotaxis protein CheY